MNQDAIEKLLVAKFPIKHVKALVRYFKKASEHFQRREWEDATAKAGKLVEAVLKALHSCAFGVPAPSGKLFKADAVMNALSAAPKGTADDAVRILIPRACRFVYDIASNRGGRHDPDEIDANEMDATAEMSNCAWIVAEMIRFSQQGVVDLVEARRMVASLVEKKFPLVEEVEGRIYFHKRGKTAPDVALVALTYRYPGRIPKAGLVDIVRRNGFSRHNARVAVSRVMRYVDENAQGLRLLNPGLAIGEGLLSGDN
jgi:hypothetical protein